MVTVQKLETIAKEWIADANLDVRLNVWDKGSYGRVYVQTSNQRGKGWIDTNGRYDFFWAYWRHTVGLSRSSLEEVAAKHGITLEEN